MVVGIGVMSPCHQVAAHGQRTNPQQPRGGMRAIEGGWQRAVGWGGDVLLIGFSPTHMLPQRWPPDCSLNLLCAGPPCRSCRRPPWPPSRPS
jgi:hypothetical protein